MTTDALVGEIETAREFLHEGTRFMKLPPNLVRVEEGYHEVNALQLGGGEGLHSTTYIATNKTVRLCSN